MLKAVKLRKVYRTDTIETTALDDIDLEMSEGQFVAVMGPSGCGKSTLLNVLGLVDAPTSGQLFAFGHDVSAWSERNSADLRKGRIGFVFQHFNLIDELTIGRNVELPLLYLHLPAHRRKSLVDVALERVGMAHRRDHLPSQLSGGEQQRAAIARAIVADQKLILADEPTGNLDSSNAEQVMKLLTELHQAGTAILMVTHSRRHTEFAQRVVHLLDGRVAQEQQRPPGVTPEPEPAVV